MTPIVWHQPLVQTNPLHDLILSQTRSLGFHRVATTRSLVFDKAQAQGTTTILISGEFLNGSVCILSRIESNNAGTTRSSIWFVLDFSLFDLADSSEQLDKVLVASRPWELFKMSALDQIDT
jgi:hypothetical protein